MGQTSSSVDWRCCRSSTLPRPDKAQDTIKIDPTAASATAYPINSGPSNCKVSENHGLDTLKKPSVIAAVADDGCLPCPSIVVTNVLPTEATVLWSCSTALATRKLHLEVLLGEATESNSIASFEVDGKEESFEIPAGTLKRAHGPYCVKVVAEAESTGVQRLSDPGLSATFFTKPEPPGVVCDLHFSSSSTSRGAKGPEIVLEWDPPQDDGGSSIHEYEVVICPNAGPVRKLSTRECTSHISELDAKGTWPLRAEVRARSAGGMLGRLSHIEILEEWLDHPGNSPTPRDNSFDKLAAEPPSQREIHQDVQQAASPWLGTGWENSYVVKAATEFEPTGDNSSTMVHVRPGDSIQVLEQHSTGWTYCKNLSVEPKVQTDSSIVVSGWVPDWVVKAKKARSASSKHKSKEVGQAVAGRTQGAAIAA